MSDNVSSLLNPLLTLLSDSRPNRPTTGGKNRQHIVTNRLRTNRKTLPKQLDKVKEGLKHFEAHEGNIILLSIMHDDSLSPTFTPDSIFNEALTKTRLITSIPKGYLVEASVDSLNYVKKEIETNQNVAQQVDISRLQFLKRFSPFESFKPDDISSLWKNAFLFKDGEFKYKAYSLWLLPYLDHSSKKAVSKKFLSSIDKIPKIIPSRLPKASRMRTASNFQEKQLDLISDKLSKYEAGEYPKITVKLTNKSQLEQIIASGTACRIDPVTPPRASLPPGEGLEPIPPTPSIRNTPVVAIVDGGLTARSYRLAVAWEPQYTFIPIRQANNRHGNQIASLVVNATGWNGNLKIPDTPCRFAPISAIPRESAQAKLFFDEDRLLDYLDNLMADHPETKVWNFSFNQRQDCEEGLVSALGHGINGLARKHNILPVISAGNRFAGHSIISPPADCDSALVVSGRKHDNTGIVNDEPCDVSRHGLGPHGTLRPDISWYSEVRVIGGVTVKGTSYAAPLVSRIAAYLFQNLKDPTPDIVRAIIINNTDLLTHDVNLGWGSPIRNDVLWLCPEGTVTIAWKSELDPGYDYYWNDLIIPDTMIEDGKLKGEIHLTAILNPKIDELGIGNYYLSRLEVALQRLKQDGKYDNILNSCSSNGSQSSRGSKWMPIRVHRGIFPRGITIIENKLRLRSRVYLRDRFKLSAKLDDGRDGMKSEVAFVLTFVCTDASRAPDTYNLFKQLMGNNVVSAVIEQEIEASL